MKHYTDSLNKFYDYLQLHPENNLKMIIGYKINNPIDTDRKLVFDIGTDLYEIDEIKMLIETMTKESKPYFILNIDFNRFCVLIESNSPISVNFIVKNQTQLLNLVKTYKTDGFYYPIGNILPKSIESLLTNDLIYEINEHITTPEKIYNQNIKFFEKWFYGSTAELLENLSAPSLILRIYTDTHINIL